MECHIKISVAPKFVSISGVIRKGRGEGRIAPGDTIEWRDTQMKVKFIAAEFTRILDKPSAGKVEMW